MTETQNASAVRTALERLASLWTATYPGGALNRYHFFGDQLQALLTDTEDAALPAAAGEMAQNWSTVGAGVPEGHRYVRGYFAFDIRLALQAGAA